MFLKKNNEFSLTRHIWNMSKCRIMKCVALLIVQTITDTYV